MSKEELIYKVKDIQDLKLMINALQGEVTSLEDEIKAEMLLQGEDELTVDIYEVRYSKVANSRFDIKSFADKHQDLYNQFTKAIEFKQLSIV